MLSLTVSWHFLLSGVRALLIIRHTPEGMKVIWDVQNIMALCLVCGAFW